MVFLGGYATDEVNLCCGASKPNHNDTCSATLVERFARPELISHETKPARPRVGNGELLRDGAKGEHVCEVLDLYRSPKLDVGAVWRCDCGKRWTYVKNAANVRSWQRRFWPWPR